MTLGLLGRKNYPQLPGVALMRHFMSQYLKMVIFGIFWPLKSRNSEKPAPISFCKLFQWRLSYLRKIKFNPKLLDRALRRHFILPPLTARFGKFLEEFFHSLGPNFGIKRAEIFWEFLEHIQLTGLTVFLICLLNEFYGPWLVETGFEVLKRYRHRRETPNSSKFFFWPTFSEKNILKKFGPKVDVWAYLWLNVKSRLNHTIWGSFESSRVSKALGSFDI